MAAALLWARANWKFLAGIALVIAIVISYKVTYDRGITNGKAIKEAEYNKAKLERVAEVKDIETSAGAITDAIGGDLAKEIGDIHVNTSEIFEHIGDHVSGDDYVSWGLVRVHDAAATGSPLSSVPIPASRPDGATSTIRATAFAARINKNYGTCRETRSKLIKLEDWVREQQALHNKHSSLQK